MDYKQLAIMIANAERRGSKRDVHECEDTLRQSSLYNPQHQPTTVACIAYQMWHRYHEYSNRPRKHRGASGENYLQEVRLWENETGVQNRAKL